MASYPPVLTKSDFTRRYLAGEFGNRAPTWDSVEDFREDVPNNLVAGDSLYHIRNRVAGGPTFYNLSWGEVFTSWLHLTEVDRVPRQSLYLSEMAPTAKTLFQGEVQQLETGLNLYYTTVPLPMRDALRKKSETVGGIVALTYLRYYLNPKSYDWMEVLLERYPGHVIEFSNYGKEWGSLPGYNTVFWEVRLY